MVNKFKKINTSIPLFGGAQGWVHIKVIHFLEFFRLDRKTLIRLKEYL